MSKEIKIFGSGCEKCNRLYERAKEAVRLTGVDAVVSKVSALDEIIALGVVPPAMVINRCTVTSGRVPSLDEMKKLIAEWG